MLGTALVQVSPPSVLYCSVVPAVTLGAKEGPRTLVLFKEGAETEKMKVLVPGFTKLDCKVKKGAGAALFEGGKASEGLKALDGVVRVLEF